jgi:hypothetical protein
MTLYVGDYIQHFFGFFTTMVLYVDEYIQHFLMLSQQGCCM